MALFLKENQIPFILFISTEPVGKHGYMIGMKLKKLNKEDFVFIGNHSHSHEYLVKYSEKKFINDIDLQ